MFLTSPFIDQVVPLKTMKIAQFLLLGVAIIFIPIRSIRLKMSGQ
jgi:hypothetical protein